jgi:putative peptide zinc metalloprotease protein
MLPRLRQELALYPGPSDYRGEPSWSLHDPVRNLFFRLDWLTFEILSRWALGHPEQIVQRLHADTPLQAETSDIESVLHFLLENELVQTIDEKASRRLHEQRLKRSTRVQDWLMHRYLFFRVPLLRPDRWLERWQGVVAPFFTRGFLWLTLGILLISLVAVSRQWESFVTSLVDLFSWQGLVSFLVALVFVKFMHELGHAFTAKRFGCHVPTMGVAFLVMFPMAYTDVNDVWKLPSRRQRLLVGAAGINTELIIAVWATLLWVLLPDGFLRGAVFILATTTWVSTLILNASPFLRFDGYFLLMDWLGMPNLHQRAFAVGKWRLRNMVFGFADEPPEFLARRQLRGLALFAYTTWLYRLIIFLGIAYLVYSFVPKPLGPVLAAVELWWFILRPIVKEVGEWRERTGEIVRSRRVRWVSAWLLVLLAVTLIPWDSRITAQGVLKPQGYFPLIAPEGARVAEVLVAHGQWVEEGAILLELDSPDLDFRQQMMVVREQTLRWQSAAAGVSPELLEQSRMFEAGRARLLAEQVSVQDEKSRFQLRSPTSGWLYLSDIDLQVGHWVGRKEQLGSVVDASIWQVITYLPESQLERVRLGDGARFYAESAQGRAVDLQVTRIDRDATRILGEGLLAVGRGGHVPVRETAQGPVPETAVYRVVLATEAGFAPDVVQIHRGALVVYGTRKSWLGEYIRRALAVVVREAGF